MITVWVYGSIADKTAIEKAIDEHATGKKEYTTTFSQGVEYKIRIAEKHEIQLLAFDLEEIGSWLSLTRQVGYSNVLPPEGEFSASSKTLTATGAALNADTAVFQWLILRALDGDVYIGDSADQPFPLKESETTGYLNVPLSQIYAKGDGITVAWKGVKEI